MCLVYKMVYIYLGIYVSKISRLFNLKLEEERKGRWGPTIKSISEKSGTEQAPGASPTYKGLWKLEDRPKGVWVPLSVGLV